MPVDPGEELRATVFVGRDRELADIRTRLSRQEVRLLTLLGPGGVGKTRLAIEAARSVSSEFPGGTFFVRLSGLREPQLVGDAIAAARELPATGPGAPVPAVLDRAGGATRPARPGQLRAGRRGRRHGGRAAVAVTSTEGPGDQPSSAPGPRGAGAAGDAAARAAVGGPKGPGTDYPAVQLFLQSARAVRPDLEVDPGTLAVIVAICRELDGLPLALELAAAMTRVLPLSAILERLRARPLSLGGGHRDMPQRHQRHQRHQRLRDTSTGATSCSTTA